LHLTQEDRINIVSNELTLYYKGKIELMKTKVQEALVGQDFMITEVQAYKKQVKTLIKSEQMMKLKMAFVEA
jgi:hypothetical protein